MCILWLLQTSWFFLMSVWSLDTDREEWLRLLLWLWPWVQRWLLMNLTSPQRCVYSICVSAAKDVVLFCFLVSEMEINVLNLVVNMCVCQVVNEVYGDSLGVELDDLPLHSDQYHMTEFAKKYFRDAQKNSRSDFTLRVQV